MQDSEGGHTRSGVVYDHAVSIPSLPPLLWLTISGLFFAGGEYLSKKFILDPRWPILLILLGMYCLGALAWLPALMQQKSLSVVGTMWSVSSLLMTICIGVLIFGERLTAVQIFGVLFAMISITALSWH